jgi:hypothetical protein
MNDKPTPHAFFGCFYDVETQRWQWTIVERGVVLAKSEATYPTQHDAQEAARTLARHLAVKA